jgi:hypothetical protein
MPLDKDEAQLIRAAILCWSELTIAEDSLLRVLLLLNSDSPDMVALKRELQSPRRQVATHPERLCFEVDMRIQCWRSQFDVYSFLATPAQKIVTQLNMGEGKTQIIIPLLILNCIYREKRIPRINILTQLMPEASSNFYKFLSSSTFQIPIIHLSFNRNVNLIDKLIRDSHRLIELAKGKCLVLIDRDSLLSLCLKNRESLMNRAMSNQPFRLL